MTNLIYQYFSDDDFLLFSERIKELEKITSGEIRLSIKERKKIFDSNKSIKELAIKEFYKLGMDKTRDKTGILLFLILQKKNFIILADEGINNKVDQDLWDGIKNRLQEKFKLGLYSEGVLDALSEVGEILSEYFPIKIDDENELPNSIIVN